MDVGLIFEVGGKCLGIVGFKTKIDLAQRIPAELVDQPRGLVAREKQLQQAAQQAQQLGVRLDRLPYPRLEDLEDHTLACEQSCAVRLGERGGSKWRGVNPAKDRVERSLEVG